MTAQQSSKMKKGIEIPISIVLFAIVGLMVFTILLGFIPKVIGGLLGAFLGQTSATKAQSIDDARGICQQWCAEAKMATSPEEFLKSNYCTNLIAVPTQGGSACLFKKSIDGYYIYYNSYTTTNNTTTCNPTFSKKNVGSIEDFCVSNNKSNNKVTLTISSFYCNRAGTGFQCTVKLKVNSGSATLEQACAAVSESNLDSALKNSNTKLYVILDFTGDLKADKNMSISDIGNAYIYKCTTIGRSISTEESTITFTVSDPCFTKASYDRQTCTQTYSAACQWTALGGYVTKHCYEDPINVICSTPPITVGTVTYSCTATSSGCICTGSDGSILK